MSQIGYWGGIKLYIFFTDCPNTYDIAFVVDTSGQLQVGQSWFLLQAFLRDLASTYRVGFNEVRISLLTYGSNTQDELYFERGTDINTVRSEIDGMVFFDGVDVNLAEAIRNARLNLFRFNPRRGERNNVPDLMIIFTDGPANVNAPNIRFEADETKREGITIQAVAFSDNFELRSQLNEVVSRPEYLVQVNGYEQLAVELNRIARELCPSLVVIPPSPPPVVGK